MKEVAGILALLSMACMDSPNPMPSVLVFLVASTVFAWEVQKDGRQKASGDW